MKKFVLHSLLLIHTVIAVICLAANKVTVTPATSFHYKSSSATQGMINDKVTRRNYKYHTAATGHSSNVYVYTKFSNYCHISERTLVLSGPESE